MNAPISDHEQERAFDWEGARRRIAEVQAAIAGLDETAPQVLEQVWAQRAARLAQAPIQESEGEQIELVLIKLGRETYGLDARHVFAIRPAHQITLVPRVPDWVTGVVNVRGHILSVIDLRRFFELPSVQEHEHDNPEVIERPSFLVVVETPSLEIALLTDDVQAVEPIPADRVQDAASTIRGIPSEYVQGVVEHKPKDTTSTDDPTLVLVLDLPALLADERLIVHEEIT